MKHFEFRSVDETYEKLVNEFGSKRHILSNYYGITTPNMQYAYSEGSLFIRCNYEGFSRIYLMSDDKEEAAGFLKELPKNSVINIPSRNGVDDWQDLLRDSDYSLIATYRRYVYSNYRKGNDKSLSFAEERDVPEIYRILNEVFSPITGHLPDMEDLRVLISKRQIVVNRNADNAVNGAMCFVIKGKRCELPFWFDNSGTGMSLLYNVFFLCHQDDVRNISFWVNDANTDTIGIHKLLGAKEDGMVDYIFNNKSK